MHTASLTAAQGTATTSTTGLSAAFKGLWDTMAPLAPSILALAALTAGIAIYAKTHPNLTKATAELKEQQEQFKSLQDEVTALNTELDTTYDRIKELQSLGSLSLVEDEELTKLQSSTVEMERQLAIKKEQLRLEAKETAKSAEKAYNASFRSKYNDNGDYLTGEGRKSNDPTQELENAIKAYYKEKEKYDNAMKNVDLFISETAKNGGRYSETGKVSYAAYEKYQKEADSYEGLMDNAAKQAQTMYDSITAQKEAYEGLSQAGETITAQQMEEYAVVKDSSLAYENFCADINNTTKAFSELNAEQKRRAISNKMTLSGVSNSNAENILGAYSDEEIDVLAKVKFDSTSTKESIDEQIQIMNKEASKGIETPSFSDLLSSLPIDKLEEYISLLNSGAIDEKTISSYSDLSAIMEQTGLSAEGAVKEMKEFAEGFTLSSELLSSLQTANELIGKVKGEIKETGEVSTDTLSSIAKQYPQLENSIAQYNQGLLSTSELMDLLETAYNSDADAFRAAMVNKLSGNEEFFTSIRDNNEGLFKSLAEAYGDDAKNWKTLAEAKANIDEVLIQQLSKAWGKYYGVIVDQATGMSSLVGKTSTTGLSPVQNAELALATVNANAMVDSANQAKKALDEAAQIKINVTDFAGIKPISSKSGSKDRSKEPTKFDWMEQKIGIIDSQVDKLKDKIDTLVGYKGKNATTDTAVDRLIEKMSILQQMHDTYMQKAGSIGLSQEYVDKIQNGTIQIETIGDENLAKSIQSYQDLYDKAQDANDRILETKKSINELNISKLDNIINQFEQLTDIQSQMIDTEKQLLELREKSGSEIEADDYSSLAQKQLELTHQNVDAYKALTAEMAKLNLEKGSEDWKKYNDQLETYRNNMISAADAIEDYKDAMTELVYKSLDDFKSKMDSINGTISTMNDLIGDTNLVDEVGNLTDRGLAQVALYAHQLTNTKQEAAEYAEAISSLNDALDSGLITQDEYNAKLYEYTSAQESAVKSSKEARDAILALVKEGIQAEIDAKKKLIDETKAALEAEQDLHDYQNSIAEKQDNISKLERQIAALSNSTSRSDIAQRLALQSQLAEAKKELYETQYDHEMEQRKNALDEEYNNFEESKQKESDELDSNLDAQNAAIDKYLKDVKENYSSVYDVLTRYGNEYSLSAIDDLTSPWESGGEAADLCANSIGDAIANIQYEINGLDFSSLYELADLFKQIGMGGYGSNSSIFEDVTAQGKWKQNNTGYWYGNSNDDYVSDGIYTINGKQYGFNSDGYMLSGWNEDFGNWRYFEPENGEMVKSSWRQSKNGDWYYLTSNGSMATDSAVKAKEGNGYYYVSSDGLWNGESLSYDDVRRLGYNIAYRHGTKNAKSGVALTDEDGLGSEVIITKNGALRQLNSGDHVFNATQVERLHEMTSGIDIKKYLSQSQLVEVTPKLNLPDFSKLGRMEDRMPNITIASPLVQIDGTGLSSAEVANIVKTETRDIDKRVAKSIRYELLGK